MANSLFLRELMISIMILMYFLSFQGVGSSLAFLIYKFINFNFGTIFQIQKPLGFVWKSNMVSCTHYTFPKIILYISMKIYKN
jgi:hypothetical protein